MRNLFVKRVATSGADKLFRVLRVEHIMNFEHALQNVFEHT